MRVVSTASCIRASSGWNKSPTSCCWSKGSAVFCVRSHQVEINWPLASFGARGAVPVSIPSCAATDAGMSAQTHSQLSVNYHYTHWWEQTNNGPAWSKGMVYLQDKNHFTALTAEALLAPPLVVNKGYLRPGGPARLPPGGPHLHARSFPQQSTQAQKKRETKSYFYGKLRRGCGAISQVHLNKSIRAYPNMKKKNSLFCIFDIWTSETVARRLCNCLSKVWIIQKAKTLSQLAQFHQWNVCKHNTLLWTGTSRWFVTLHHQRKRVNSQATNIFRFKLLNIINSHHLKQPGS